MSIHVCKQCGLRFEYCRMCVFRPIRYKDNGFCSKECYEASKNTIVPVVEPEVIEEIVVAEEPKHIDDVTEYVVPMVDEVSTEVEAETVVLEETDVVEKPIIVESTFKNETNTYKKKKSKN